MPEIDDRDFPGGQQRWCEVKVDGLIREGLVRAWSARPNADPPGWWAFVEWHDEKGTNRITWFPESAVLEAPEQ